MKKSFKAIILFVSFLAIGAADAALNTGVTSHNHSSANTGGGTLNLTGTASSTKACASGFTREGPNLCMRQDAIGLLGALTLGACTAITVPAADAKVMILHLDIQARSNNSIATRSITFTGLDNACTFSLTSNVILTREFAAVSAGTTIAEWRGQVFIPVLSGGNKVECDDDGSGQGTCQYQIRGYTD